MSWDILLLRFERAYDDVDAMPDGVEGLPLGSAGEIRRRIAEVFVGADWGDPEWGKWSSDDGSIEFNGPKGDDPTSVMLHVRAGDSVVAGIVELCRRNGWQALDIGTGAFLDRQAVPADGLRRWRAFRDRVIPPHPSSGASSERQA